MDPGKRRGWGIHLARGGIFVMCRQGLTLPPGLLHAGASPRDSCHPSMPLGCGLGHTFTFLCFSVTFLGAFAIVCRALHGWETAALDGEVPFPKKKELVFRFAAGFAVVELTADSPVPFPSAFESSGAPELSPLLHLSFVCFSWLLDSTFRGSSGSAGASICSELTYERALLLPSQPCFPSSPKGIPFCLQISNNQCGRRGGEVLCCATPRRAAVTWTETWGQAPPSPRGCGKELPPRSGCSSGHFQCCRELSRLIKGCWVNY